MATVMMLMAAFSTLEAPVTEATVGTKYQLIEQLKGNNILSRELDISEHQREQLSRFLKENNYFSYQGRRQKLKGEQREKFAEVTERMLDEFIGETLVESQVERFRQIALQFMVLRADLQDGFSHPLTFGHLIDLTDVERESLRGQIDKKRFEYYKEEARLRKEAIQNILNSLSKKERELIQEQIGEPIDFYKIRGIYDLEEEREKNIETSLENRK